MSWRKPETRPLRAVKAARGFGTLFSLSLSMREMMAVRIAVLVGSLVTSVHSYAYDQIASGTCTYNFDYSTCEALANSTGTTWQGAGGRLGPYACYEYTGRLSSGFYFNSNDYDNDCSSESTLLLPKVSDTASDTESDAAPARPTPPRTPAVVGGPTN